MEANIGGVDCGVRVVIGLALLSLLVMSNGPQPSILRETLSQVFA